MHDLTAVMHAEIKVIDQCFSTFLLQRNPTQVWQSLTEPHAMICESSSKVEFVWCLGTDVPSGVKRQRTRESGAKPSNTDDKAASKRLV